VLRALDRPSIDFHDPDFVEVYDAAFAGVKRVLKTQHHLFMYNASGHGAWEASLTNLLSPGDAILVLESGYFSEEWAAMARSHGLEVRTAACDWRRGVDIAQVKAALAEDTAHAIKAVCVVHNETSTGATSRIDEVRRVIDAAKHPALFMVDTISSLASIDYRHDEWGVDVTVGGSQKGLMLPPGLGFNAVSEKALAATKTSKLPKSYFAWEDMLGPNKEGFFPYTPATNLLYGLAEAIDMLHEEGLERVFARHDRHAEGVRRAVRAWGLEIWCKEAKYYSSSLTAILMPAGHNADAFRKTALEHFDVSLGTGLSKVAGKVFRIGHLGDTNDLTMIATLAGVEMGLKLAGVPHKADGVRAAMDYFTGSAKPRGD
jgi:alanine-glyoxylate transaminase/serine-glyoxylate transaminase/serine-pyruvate transaminase